MKFGKRAFHDILLTGLALAPALAAGMAQAREPGAGNVYAPGSSIGIPSGTNVPPGLWLEDTSSISEVQATSPGTGDANSTKITALATAPRLLWTTPWTFLGASEMAFVVVPMIHLNVSNMPAPNPAGTYSRTAFGNPGIEPISLSWTLAPGLFADLGFAVYFPIGQYSKGAQVNVGDNFWTFQPEASVSYLGGGYNLTAHLLYHINTKNTATDYTSGNQLFLDLTAAKTFGKWTAGVVGFYDKQVTADSNAGTSYGPVGSTFGEPGQFAPGLLLGYNFGPVVFTAYFTHTVVANDGGTSGTNVYARVFLPLM